MRTILFASAIVGALFTSHTPAAAQGSARPSPAFTAADVAFMQGMIQHHAQAVMMSAFAPTHGASAAIRSLAERIDVSQRDEIGLMQRWLADRHQSAPDPLAARGAHGMNGMPGMPTMSGMADSTMPKLMPGMLTPAQMKQLDAARGAEFDRLFLTFMIQHHRGALTMVDDLFAVPGAGQENQVFRFASDVTADQTAEIGRMEKMLGALGR
ncbi:MAG TPA: DUF305 domain-containing protein [Gemmatimonadaceae bacterium]|nr:DUF305 domain-containing protein [Gemmatimonadaceae bacterium]